MTWMIYGANGYTGALVCEEAVRRGHRPIVAGRSLEKVRAVADRFGLEPRAFALDDPRAAAAGVRGVELVFHAAGPFVFTSAPMVAACLAEKASYVDITGEIPVFQSTFARDAAAKSAGVCLMSGVGFDVIPTDCLAKWVADKVPGATELEIAIAAIGKPSGGTMKSAVELLPKGNFARRGGELVSIPTATPVRRVRFSDRERTVIGIPWGDLETAYVSTKIPSITTYMAQPERVARVLGVIGPAIGALMSIAPVRRLAQRAIERTVTGPDAAARAAGRSFVWARASSGRESAEAWLETLEGYHFTAVGGVRSVERILEKKPVGALTPSLAFGADFVLEIEGTRRLDRLPG